MGKNKIFDEAKKILSENHNLLQLEVQSNISKAKSDDEFSALNAKKRELIFELGKYANEEKDVKPLVDELKEITKKQEIVLKKIGLTFNDLKEKFNCEKCKDEGVINGEYCVCFKRILSDILLKESGLNKTNLPKFSDVDYSLYSDAYVKNMKIIYDNIENYINNLKNQEKHIVTISGPTGVGKTFLTECIVERAIEQGYYTIYTTSIGLNVNMLKYHTAQVNEKQNIIEPYLTCDLLIIDDLGTEPIFNNVTIEYLYLVISERLKAGLYTFINTNLTPNQIIDVYGERIFSRIANIRDTMLINMNANDIRLGLRK